MLALNPSSNVKSGIEISNMVSWDPAEGFNNEQLKRLGSCQLEWLLCHGPQPTIVIFSSLGAIKTREREMLDLGKPFHCVHPAAQTQ